MALRPVAVGLVRSVAVYLRPVQCLRSSRDLHLELLLYQAPFEWVFDLLPTPRPRLMGAPTFPSLFQLSRCPLSLTLNSIPRRFSAAALCPSGTL